MQEELTTHDVEGNVMGCPGEEEEARGVVKAGACAWDRCEFVHDYFEDCQLTLIKGIHATAEGQLISANDASKDRKQRRRQPPSDRVPQEIYLLTGVVVCPE